MRVVSYGAGGQGFPVFLLLLLLLLSCQGKEEQAPVIPPPTPPLSRPVIGYGVIDASYIRVTAEPDEAALSLGYLRRGAFVEILERRSVPRGDAAETWVFLTPADGEGGWKGWLRESQVQIYDNRAKARTAAQGLPK